MLYKNVDMNKKGIMKTICTALLCTMLLQGCTSYHTYDVNKSNEMITEINEKAETKNTNIIMIDGNKYSANNLVFKPDSSKWYNEDKITQLNYPNTDINQIVFSDGKRGAWDGFRIGSGLGLLFGVGLCTLMSLVMPGGSNDYPVDCALKAGLTLGLISGLVGIGIGAKVGHTHVYMISSYDEKVGGTP